MEALQWKKCGVKGRGGERETGGEKRKIEMKDPAISKTNQNSH